MIPYNYVLMCKEAYPYFKGFIKENTFDAVWCDGYKIYCQPFGQGTNYSDLGMFVEPPIKDIEPFRIFTQRELQEFINKNESWVTFFLVFKDWVLLEVILSRKVTKFNNLDELWLGFVMEHSFKRNWNSKTNKWDVIS